MTWHYMALGPSLVWSGLRLALIAVAVTAFVVGLILIMFESED